jgi:hypothetical protein
MVELNMVDEELKFFLQLFFEMIRAFLFQLDLFEMQMVEEVLVEEVKHLFEDFEIV